MKVNQSEINNSAQKNALFKHGRFIQLIEKELYISHLLMKSLKQ